MNLLLFGGTTEGRLLAKVLTEAGHQVTVSVATPLGAEELRSFPGVRVLTGPLDLPAMKALVGDYSLCLDATHPYAVEVTENLKKACAAVGTPLRRLVRQAGRPEGCVLLETAQEAASYLRDKPGNILLTTGAKELPAFSALPPERLFPRVLPTCEAITACERLGIPHRNILALQGPFTQELNEAILGQYHIRWLVTKDGGQAGGFEEKCAAARAKQVPILLLRRPAEAGSTMEDILKELGREEAL